MRVDIPDHCSRRQAESETAGHSPGGSNLPLRYSNHEVIIYDRDFAESKR